MADPDESWRDIRPVALGIVRREGADGEEMLVTEHYDEAAEQSFYRPPGGGIGFGEAAAAAVEREFAEELGWDVTAGERLAVLENRFTFDGSAGHEYVFVYPVEPRSSSVYERESFEATEPHGETFRVRWRSLDSFRVEAEPPLFPEGLLGVLTECRP